VESKGSDENKAAERQTQKKVLQLLQQIGPTNYNLLFLQFEPYNGFLQEAIDELLHGKLIEMDSEKMVHITDAGYRLLDNLKYWSKLSLHS
jgi:hypothetical protein